MLNFLKRVLLSLVAIELIYLAVLNIALNISVTQNLINKIKPDKFAVSWESAWTLYPFHIHARGVTTNGQIPGQQWQLETPEASASIALLPLIFKRVKLSNIEARDVTYHQRPRPREGKDYSNIREFFAPIKGRELESTPPPALVKKKGGSWKISIRDMRAHGQHKLWLYQMQAMLEGNVSADLAVQTRGGPFSLSNGNIDAKLKSVMLNGDREVSRNGKIQGTVELLPFVVKENKGLKSLAFLKLDANISSHTESLAFLNLYLRAFQGMTLDGAGEVNGRLVLKKGKLQPETSIDVSAASLGLNMLGYRIEGDGEINIQVPPEEAQTQFAIAFNQLVTSYKDETTPMFTGNGLVVNGSGSSLIIPLEGERFRARRLSMFISSVAVPDLKVYQRFMPDKWALKLLGGEGALQGKIEANHRTFSSDLRLSSEDAQVGVKNYDFQSNLDMRLKLNSPDLEIGKFDVSGTYVKLHGAKISTDTSESKSWHAAVQVDKGMLELNIEKASDETTGAQNLARAFREYDVKILLGEAHNDLKISGNISDLRWLNLLIQNPYDLAISGSGEINSDIVVNNGWLAEGTQLIVEPDEMAVDVLDYRADGDGGIEFKVVKGGEFPDISLNVEIDKAQFKRKNEDQAFIEDVHIILKALARGIETEKTAQGKLKQQDVDLHLSILSAKVLDMSIYNQYLPDNSPLTITDGQASLTADIELQPDDARGFVKLVTEKVAGRVDDQTISAELNAEIKLVGGTPKDMNFDITGSEIRVDKVRVTGEAKSFREDDWAAKFRLTRGETVWRKPVQLDLEAELDMTDSIPIVSMMANQKGKQTWLGKALTIDDVSGIVEMKMADQQIIIPYAYASSNKIDVGAKGVIRKDFRDGVLFARYGKLHGILKIRDGDRNIDVLRARIKFDEYSAEGVALEKLQAE